ncbi:hypothetical protein QJS10_CPB17g02569 [Acorus calamus]|uniref:Uncharacterized protein n=1 Tax=Acorus calamus TaxID=4465 RepID=A0AAV9CUS4_ACOCL|nr:hypothetical protein QJS10_CPB17g02569 [Acorus calamus]
MAKSSDDDERLRKLLSICFTKSPGIWSNEKGVNNCKTFDKLFQFAQKIEVLMYTSPVDEIFRLNGILDSDVMLSL